MTGESDPLFVPPQSSLMGPPGGGSVMAQAQRWLVFPAGRSATITSAMGLERMHPWCIGMRSPELHFDSLSRIGPCVLKALIPTSPHAN